MKRKAIRLAALLTLGLVGSGNLLMGQLLDNLLRNLPFEFALIGDSPYGPTTINAAGQKVQAYPATEFLNTIADINNHPLLAFTAHIGDVHAGDTLCSNEIYTTTLGYFNSFRSPFIFVPGDNEWTDCHRTTNGIYRPVERLAYMRNVYYPNNQSLGQRKITLLRQSDDPGYAAFQTCPQVYPPPATLTATSACYKENVIWTTGAVLFVGLNVPGSNNNFNQSAFSGVPNPFYNGPTNFDGNIEAIARDAANLYWLNKAFDMATNDTGLKGVMVLVQANLFDRYSDGYVAFLDQLRRRTVALNRPVVLVGGDSHYFRIDKPLYDKNLPLVSPNPAVTPAGALRIENFTRVEVFGDADTHWVKGTVNPFDPNVFSFQPITVQTNVKPHPILP